MRRFRSRGMFGRVERDAGVTKSWDVKPGRVCSQTKAGRLWCCLGASGREGVNLREQANSLFEIGFCSLSALVIMHHFGFAPKHVPLRKS